MNHVFYKGQQTAVPKTVYEYTYYNENVGTGPKPKLICQLLQ